MHVSEICNLGPCGTARKIARTLPSASGPESAARGRLFPCVDVRPRLSWSLPAPPLSLGLESSAAAEPLQGDCLKPVASFPKVSFSVS